MIQGFSYFLKALNIIWTDRHIRNLSLFPVFMFLILLTIGAGFGLFYIDELLMLFFADQIAHLQAVLKGVLYVLSFFLLGFLYYVFVFLIISLLSIPLGSVIAEKTMLTYTQLKDQKTDFLYKIKSSISMLRVTLVKLVLFAFIGFLLFICSFVPVLSPFVFISSLMLLAFDSTDFAFEKMNFNFKERVRFFKKNIFKYFGLCIGVGIVILVPFIQFAVLPIMVIATTLLFSEEYTKKVL